MQIGNYKNKWRHLLTLTGVALGYFILARFSLLLSFQTSNATPVWPPSGLAFAAILYFGFRVTPAIFVGAFAANMVVFQLNHAADLTTGLWVSTVISVGNTAEAVTGCLLLKKLIPHGTQVAVFSVVRNIFRFLLVVVIMCMVSSVIGSTAVYAGGIIDGSQFTTTWLTWWLGDVSGIILVTPVILTWINFNRQRKTTVGSDTNRTAVNYETFILFALVILASGIVFDDWFFSLGVFKWPFWIIPVMLWASIRFRPHESVTTMLVCALISVWGTINGHGPFIQMTEAYDAGMGLNDSLLIQQSFTCIVTISALTVNASVQQRKETEARLRQLGNELERRVMERTAELSERNRFIETLFDSVEDLMAVFDKEGNFISVNKKMEVLYNVRREDIINKNVLEVFPAVKDSEMPDNLKRAAAGETFHNMSYRSLVTNRYYENFYIPLKKNSNEVYGVLVIGHDNTAVMRAAENIETVNARLTEAQRLAHIGNWEWDIASDRISWSDELFRIFGYNPGEFEPGFGNFLNCIHPADREEVKTIIMNAFTNAAPFHFYHRVVRPDNTVRILHGRGEVYTGDDGKPKSMAGTAQDVTELKEAENEILKISEELARYNRELEQSNKELESFTFIASHDLQEPLRKIRTFLSLIFDREHEVLSATGKDYIQRTIRAATQMQALISDLLLYSRTTGSIDHLKRTNLNDILKDVLAELGEMIGDKNVTVEIGTLPTLCLIPFQMQQFFTNIIGNSLKFAREEVPPHIRITSSIADKSSLAAFSADSQATYHRITVSDNGIGFDPRHNEKIFDLFKRLHTRDQYSGTGIGLAICKKIIENHDGFITAEGVPGEGALFTIYLPEREDCNGSDPI